MAIFCLGSCSEKKGQGVTVAMIDTGSPVFDIPSFDLANHPNLTFDDGVLDYSLNLVSKDGLDPIHQLAMLIKQYCKESVSVSSIEQGLADMIVSYLQSNDTSGFVNLLLKNGNSLSKNSATLNSAGEEALEDILHGEEGISPQGYEGYFSLATCNSETVIAQTLPSPSVHKEMEFMSTHGAFNHSIVAGVSQFEGDVTGIAPNVSFYPIKALEDDGSTTKENLDHALRKALVVNPDILNLSLKYGESFDPDNDADSLMKELIGKFKYPVIASGNDGDVRSPSYAGKKVAYPARFDNAIDVGGFAYDGGKNSYGSFSQYESGIGPKFLAPGFNMLAAAIDPSDGSMSTMFMAGTSAATPIVTGCLSLILAEFQDVFSREVILKVVSKSAIRMNGSNKWKDDVGLGMIDVRSALLCLHVMKAIKEQNIFDVDSVKNGLIDEIFTIIFTNPDIIASNSGIEPLRSNLSAFENYSSISKKSQGGADGIIQYENISSIQDAIDIIVEKIKTQSAEELKKSDSDFYTELTSNKGIQGRVQLLIGSNS